LVWSLSWQSFGAEVVGQFLGATGPLHKIEIDLNWRRICNAVDPFSHGNVALAGFLDHAEVPSFRHGPSIETRENFSVKSPTLDPAPDLRDR
jgi:hypothetical protein